MQANKFSTSYVDSRIEAFLEHTQKLLSKISVEDMTQSKEDLIKTKQCTDVHLKEEVDRNWSEIIADDYMFDRLKREIEAIGDVKINDIREWWDKHNLFGNQENYRKLSIQVNMLVGVIFLAQTLSLSNFKVNFQISNRETLVLYILLQKIIINLIFVLFQNAFNGSQYITFNFFRRSLATIKSEPEEILKVKI